MQQVQNIELFKQLSLEQIEHALALTRKMTVRRGEYIFLTGESADYLFILETGLVKIAYVTADGNERIIDFRNDGSIFGELFLGKYRHRVGIAQALADSVIYKLCENCLFQISTHYPIVNRNFINHLVDSQRETFARMHALSWSDAKLRLLGLLVVLARQSCCSVTGEYRLHPNITQEDIANMAGLNRSTVSSIINECRRDGLLSGSRRKVVVHVREIEALLDEHGSEVLV